MGNQASKVIEKTKERRGNKTRRKSTATVGGGRSHSSLSISHTSSSNSHGNYDWVEPSSGSGAIDAAMAAAGMADARKPPTTNENSTLTPRRKSVSEILAKRKGSFSRISMSPEDVREYDRLQRQHYLLKSARKSNTVAPVENPKFILDLGSAGGIWALEMAASFPDAQVIGIDIQPPPLQQNAPKNLKFIESNIYEKFPMADASVDLVFQRGMGHIIRKDKWPHVLEEMFRVLKPGGYVELVEADLWHHNPGPVQQAFDAFMQEQCSEYGLDFVFTESLSTLIENTGFVDVSHTSLDIPVGEWPKDPELKQYGFINKETQKAYLRNRKQFYVSAWGIAPEDYDLAVQEVMDEFEEYHGFSRFNSWVAKKPAN